MGMLRYGTYQGNSAQSIYSVPPPPPPSPPPPQPRPRSP